MSSDVDDEQVLPDSLQKLEIVPINAQNQVACKIDQNPFYTVFDTEVKDLVTSDDRFVSLFGPSCNNCTSCDTTNSKETNRSNRHTNRGSNTNHNSCANGNIEHSIHKQIHFKQRDKEKMQAISEKKLLILREPILKSIGRSVYHNHSHSRLMGTLNCDESCSTGANAASNSIIDEQILPDGDSTLLVSNGNSNRNNISDLPMRNRSVSLDSKVDGLAIRQNWRLQNESPVDFKSLVKDCSNLSLATTAETNDQHPSFTTLHRTRSSHALQPNDSSISESTSTNSEMAASVNILNSNMSSSSSNSSSCSQQARMNSSNCDVTIDELASYFETFVHIPKKMSSMAEMMYI